MTYAEAPAETVLRFSSNWAEQLAANRLVANLISVNKETNRQPDTYYFSVRDGLLMDPESGKPVLDFVLPGVERGLAIELQTWADRNNEGFAFWISPPLEGVYPCAKAIFHRIAYTFGGEKVVLNSAILFDAEFKNPELLRQTLFTQEDTEENILGVLEWIQAKSEQVNIEAVDEKAAINQASYFAGRLQEGVPVEHVVREMQQTGFLGPNPVSCPGGRSSFLNLIDSRSSLLIQASGEDEFGPLAFECPNPKCKKINVRPPHRLLPVCQHCGADVSCKRG